MTMIRHVFKKEMVAHVWAQRSHSEGRSTWGNFYFRGAAIYSYDFRFMVARFVKNEAGQEAIFMTTRDYFGATRSHIALAKAAVAGKNILYVSDPERSCHITHKAEFEKTIEEWLLNLAKTRSPNKIDDAISRITSAVQNANAYAEFFGLEWRIQTPIDNGIASDAVKKAKKKLAREREAKRLKYEQDAKDWLAGNDVYPPYDYPKTLLRIKGEAIETSLSSKFPIEHGRKAFAFILKCREEKTGWQHNGHKIPLGHFQIDRIEPDGTVLAGCHIVRWEAIEPVARELGLIA